jgi:indolepyruvate ferredoxin oxidoreductase alpha subunit
MKKMMQDNEAIARGAWEAGLSLACSYPGTPSNEILAELAKYKEICTE